MQEIWNGNSQKYMASNFMTTRSFMHKTVQMEANIKLALSYELLSHAQLAIERSSSHKRLDRDSRDLLQHYQGFRYWFVISKIKAFFTVRSEEWVLTDTYEALVDKTHIIQVFSKKNKKCKWEIHCQSRTRLFAVFVLCYLDAFLLILLISFGIWFR